MRRPMPSSALGKLALSSLFVAMLCSTSCAGGSQRAETVPRCPPMSEAAIEGYALVLTEQAVEARPSANRAAFISYFESLSHYCRRVLPAWIGD